MNAVAETLGLSLPGCSAIPAPYRERGQMAYETGRRAVEMAFEDLRPSKILTRESFLNAITAIAALGGSTNAQPHLTAMARHAGLELHPQDWTKYGHEIPLLLNMQPAGKYLGERFHRAGGVPAVLHELIEAGKLHADTMTVDRSHVERERQRSRQQHDREMITTYDKPLREQRGLCRVERQSVRLCDPQGERDHRGFPPSLSGRGRTRQRVRGPRSRVRWLR